jgi:hypothetical protein
MQFEWWSIFVDDPAGTILPMYGKVIDPFSVKGLGRALCVPITKSTQVKNGTPLPVDRFLEASQYTVRRQARCADQLRLEAVSATGEQRGEQMGSKHLC